MAIVTHPDWGIASVLHFEGRLPERSTVHTRRGARLEATQLKAELVQLRCRGLHQHGRRLARPHVRDSPEITAARRNVPAVITTAAASIEPVDRQTTPLTRSFESTRSPIASSWINCYILLKFERLFHCERIEALVLLGSFRLNGWSFAGVEHANVERCAVSDLGHLAAHRIDFGHDMGFAGTPDRRIAGHVPDSIEIGRDHKCRQPARAAARAASQPAWPEPTMTTSKRIGRFNATVCIQKSIGSHSLRPIQSSPKSGRNPQ